MADGEDEWSVDHRRQRLDLEATARGPVHDLDPDISTDPGSLPTSPPSGRAWGTVGAWASPEPVSASGSGAVCRTVRLWVLRVRATYNWRSPAGPRSAIVAGSTTRTWSYSIPLT